MAPKKAAAVLSATEVTNKENAASNAGTPQVKLKVKLVKAQAHPSTLTMVVEVLKKNTERKGTSVPAIRNQILAAHPSVDPIRLKFLLRSALNKGIERGILARPLNSSATGATGWFKLAKPEKAAKEGKEENKMSENVNPNAAEKPKKAPKKEETPKEAKDQKKPKAERKRTKDSNEKPKATKAKKEGKVVAPAKKPKAKMEAGKSEGETQATKQPSKSKTKEVKPEAAKVSKDTADGSGPAKAGKKGKK